MTCRVESVFKKKKKALKNWFYLLEKRLFRAKIFSLRLV